MADAFDELHRLGILPPDLTVRLKKGVGFRNIAVHAYQRINWVIVYSIITTRLEDFRQFADAIATALTPDF